MPLGVNMCFKHKNINQLTHLLYLICHFLQRRLFMLTLISSSLRNLDVLSTHSLHQCPSIVELLNTLYQSPRISSVVFGGLLFPRQSWPCTWQLIWGPGGRSLDAALTDLAVLNSSDDERTEQMKKMKRRWREKKKWKWRMEGRRTQKRCLRSSGDKPHIT